MLKSATYLDLTLWIIIAICLGLSIYSSWCGLGLTYDSNDYLSAASSFSSDQILLNKDGSPYSFHAPLFPIILSIMGDDPLFKIKVLNIVFLLMTMIAMLVIIRQSISNHFLIVMSFTAIFVSVGQQMIYSFVWTEPTFVFLFMLHNIFLIRYLKGTNQYDFFGMILFAFLMGITKNTGFFIIIPTTLFLLIQLKTKRFATSLVYFFIGSSGFIAWNLYAFFVLGLYLEVYDGVGFLNGGLNNLINYLDIISQWFLPSVIPMRIRLIIELLLLGIGLKMLRLNKMNLSAKVFLAQFVCYTIVMVFFVEVDKDEIERLLSIIYPWFIIGLFILIDSGWSNLTIKVKRVFILFFVFGVVYIGIRSFNNIDMWHHRHCVKNQIYDKGNDT